VTTGKDIYLCLIRVGVHLLCMPSINRLRKIRVWGCGVGVYQKIALSAMGGVGSRLLMHFC